MVKQVTSASLRYPLSVFNTNSTLKAGIYFTLAFRLFKGLSMHRTFWATIVRLIEDRTFILENDLTVTQVPFRNWHLSVGLCWFPVLRCTTYTMYIYIFTYVCVYVCICICMYTYVYVHMYILIYMCIHKWFPVLGKNVSNGNINIYLLSDSVWSRQLVPTISKHTLDQKRTGHSVKSKRD